MARLDIPSRDLETLKSYIDLPLPQKQHILHLFKEVKRNEKVSSIAELLVAKSGVSKDFARKIVSVMISLRGTQMSLEIADQELASDIIANLYSEFAGEIEPNDDWEEDVINLVTTGTIEFKLLAKSFFTINDSANIFYKSKIITDVRPIFIDNTIEGMMIYHNLKVTFGGTNGEQSDFFVALDTSDLEKLKKTVDKSLEEANVLKETFKNQLIIPEDEN